MVQIRDKQNNLQIKIINSFFFFFFFFLNNDNRWAELCFEWKILVSVLRERQTSMDIFWLQLKEQLLHAPQCVVSCFTKVHNEQNYPSFSFNWRKSIIHMMGPAGHFKVLITYMKTCLHLTWVKGFFGREPVFPDHQLLRSCLFTCHTSAATLLSWDLNSSVNTKINAEITKVAHSNSKRGSKDNSWRL